MWTQNMKHFVDRLVYKYHNILKEEGYDIRDIRGIKYTRNIKTHGMCTIHKDGTITISISEVCFHGGESSLRNTILHELTHGIRGCVEHGIVWQKYAKEIGTKFGVKIEQYVSKEEHVACREYKESRYNWEVTCLGCGSKTKSIRKTKLVTDVMEGRGNNWKCSCGSREFKVRSLKKGFKVYSVCTKH